MKHTLTKTQYDWIQDYGYYDPQYISGLGWYAFKGSDVMPTFIQPYFTYIEYNRQRVHPCVDLTKENL